MIQKFTHFEIFSWKSNLVKISFQNLIFSKTFFQKLIFSKKVVTMFFRILLRKQKKLLYTSHKSWEPLVTLPPPSDCWAFSEQINPKKPKYYFFVQPTKKEVPCMEMSREIGQKKERFSLNGNVTWNWPEKKRTYATIGSCKVALLLPFTKINRFFQLPACCPVHPRRTTLLLRQRSWIASTMCTWEKVLTDLSSFPGPKLNPFTWM